MNPIDIIDMVRRAYHARHDRALSADDVRAARLDTDAHGRIFPEVERAAMLQVLRDIRDNQPTASAPVRGLAAAIIEKLGE